MGNLPTRKGPWIGRGNERQMMSETNVSEFRKRYRTNPDGSVTMLKTRGGFPQFTTTEIRQQAPLSPAEWIFQATTRIGETWKSDSYLSKTKVPALVLNGKEFIGHANWFGVADSLPVTISYSTASTSYGGLSRLGNYGGDLPGVVFRNGEKILDLSGAVIPGYESYEAGASLICAGMSSGVPIAVIKIRYYTDTTSELALIRMNAESSYGSVDGWEFVSSEAIGWNDPILYQQAVMNSSGTEFSAIIMNLVDDSGETSSLWKYQPLVRTWQLPTFTHSDSHEAERRDFEWPGATWNPGIESYGTLPGDVTYLQEVKAAESYFLEQAKNEYEFEIPQFVSYDGDTLKAVTKIAKFRDVSYYNQLGGTGGLFSQVWSWQSFDMGSSYEDNLAIMTGLVFDGGYTLSLSAAESHARSATLGASYATLSGLIADGALEGVSADVRYFYWRDGDGGISYTPLSRFGTDGTQFEKSFRRTDYCQGVRISGGDTLWLGNTQTATFGDEDGGVTYTLTSRVDRSPSIGSASYFVANPGGSELPGITVTVARLITSYTYPDPIIDILVAEPEINDSESNDPLIWHDARGPLYVRWLNSPSQLEARFSPPETGASDIGELENLGSITPILYTQYEARLLHPSSRIALASLHQGLVNATVLLIDNPDATQLSGGTPIETTLYHASPSGALTEIPEPEEGEVFVTATYFRK